VVSLLPRTSRPGRRIRFWLTKGHPGRQTWFQSEKRGRTRASAVPDKSSSSSSHRRGIERERERERREGRGRGQASGYRHKGQLKSQSSGPNYVEKRAAGRERGRPRAPIYNKMKAIRGDNPRTTNQRVYLMPVVPPPSPERPPDTRRGTVFPLFPPQPARHHRRRSFSVCLHACLSPSRSSRPPPLSLSLSLSFVPLVEQPVHSPSPFADPPFRRSRSRVIVLLLSDMSLCYRHNQPPFLSSLLIAHRAPSSPHPAPLPATHRRRCRRVLFATCRTLAHPRDLAQSVLLY